MDQNEIIIENVRQHECLYNVASKNYKNVQKKNEIWEKIGDLVNLSGETCRKRWKGLRDRYKRYKRSTQLASGSGPPSPANKWKYMESLGFLDDFDDTQEKIGSVESKTGHIFNLTPQDENTNTDESSTERSESKPKMPYEAHAEAEVTAVFKEAKKEHADSVGEIASACLVEKSCDSTSLLFESLAKIISEANLPQAVVARIKANALKLVNEEIDKYSHP